MRHELNDAQYAAMLKVRHRLEDDEFKFFHTNIDFFKLNQRIATYAPEEHRPREIFAMDAIYETYSFCGTVGCIYGWMHHEMDPQRTINPNAALALIIMNRPRLHELFFARRVAARYKITPKQAVQAIDNYLMGIDPIWGHVL